jgi:class 3 adenylate cyclase/HAMP domain-containing protein
VLPLVIVPLVLAEAASYIAATKGINRVTERFLGFKSAELQKYAESQWKLLVDNDYAGREDMIEAAKNAVQLYAQSILTSETEEILAVDETGSVRMEAAAANSAINSAAISGADAPGDAAISGGEIETLLTLLKEENNGIQTASIGGVERVFRSFYFPPFGWYVLTTEEKAVFYHDADSIKLQTIVVIVGASSLAVLLLIIFSLMLARPISKVAAAMNGIIGKGEMTARVEVEYRDETGALAHTFNVMIADLEDAYKQIKKHAFEAVLAQKKEQRIRQIFQKYVPKEIIDKFFAAPESMLVGDNRDLAILFSDIRGFTTISEGMKPDDLVASLNRYFSGQVDIIMNRNGVVDKYIGDAIMAFWGAPLKHADDAMQAVLSGLDMIDALKTFNAKQQSLGKPEFGIGIGIGYGSVTVGNIGSERKMDYTVIGDMVNLASRMEGLTKVYRAEILISESLFDQIRPALESRAQPLSVRLLDKVAVKGKTQGVKIFTVKRDAPAAEQAAWLTHNQAMKLYFQRSFAEAAALFRDVARSLPGDFSAQTMLTRCEAYAKTPPPPDWDGVEVMHSK